jgi:hypothetical protein
MNHLFLNKQRAILNFTPRGELGPQGWNLSPRGNVHPFVHPTGWTLSTYCSEEWRGEQRISPPGDNFTLRGQNLPLGGTTSPLGSKFAPRGEVKYGPQLPLQIIGNFLLKLHIYICRMD